MESGEAERELEEEVDEDEGDRDMSWALQDPRRV